MPLILAPPPDQILPNKTISRLVGKMGSSAQKVCNELQKELRKKPTGDDCTMIVVGLGA